MLIVCAEPGGTSRAPGQAARASDAPRAALVLCLPPSHPRPPCCRASSRRCLHPLGGLLCVRRQRHLHRRLLLGRLLSPNLVWAHPRACKARWVLFAGSFLGLLGMGLLRCVSPPPCRATSSSQAFRAAYHRRCSGTRCGTSSLGWASLHLSSTNRSTRSPSSWTLFSRHPRARRSGPAVASWTRSALRRHRVREGAVQRSLPGLSDRRHRVRE